MIHQPTTSLIEMHRRLGDARLLRQLGQFSVGQAHDALQSLSAAATQPTATAEKLAAALQEKQAQVLTILDPEYPVCFRSLETDAPPLLYILGTTTRLKQRSIAIIGTRRPSAAGRAAARTVAEFISSSGWTIISGNAPGIDSAAHEAAVKSGGETLVCPPVPLDQYTPSFRGGTPEQVTVVTPFIPGTKIEPWMFLRRNTLVAAHCQAAFVAETGSRGGTLDTVRKLHRFHRDVFATRLPPEAKFYNAHQSLASGGGVTLLDAATEAGEWPRQIIESAENCLRHPAICTHVLDDFFPETFTND